MKLKEIIRQKSEIELVAREWYDIQFDERGRGRCPFPDNHTHGDANPSLRLDRNKGRIRCFSQGCFNEKGVDVFGLVMKMDGVDFPSALGKLAEKAGVPQRSSGQTSNIVATYDYRDRGGNLLYQIVRKEPGKNGHDKDFVIRRPNGAEGWIWNGSEVNLVVYRLDELPHTGRVVIVEGEKCVDALQEMGIPATCNPFGAGKWRDEFKAWFEDIDVILWPDKDSPGYAHVEQIARSLYGTAKFIRVVLSPAELPEKGDVMDGIERLDWSRDDIEKILTAAPAWEPSTDSERSVRSIYNNGTSERKITLNPQPVRDLMRNAPEIKWQVDKLLADKSAMVIVADGGTGKTWLTLALALAVDQGIPWLDNFSVKQGKVLIIDEENSRALLKHRLEKLLRAHQMPEDGSTLGIEILPGEGINLSDRAYVESLTAVLEEKKPDLVIVDALVRVHTYNENDAGEMAQFFGQVKRWMNEYDCSFIFCHHHKKPGMTSGDPSNQYRGSSEIRAFVDSHLDLKKVRDEQGVLTVTHAKSRFIEELPAFNVEIADVDEGATTVRFAGAPILPGQEKLEAAQDFIRELAADGDWHSRQEILDQGRVGVHKRDLLDKARKLLVEADEIVEEKRGKEIGIKRSDAPYIYKERTERSEASEGQIQADLLEEETI